MPKETGRSADKAGSESKRGESGDAPLGTRRQANGDTAGLGRISQKLGHSRSADEREDKTRGPELVFLSGYVIADSASDQAARQ